MKRLTGENGLFPSRSELVRVATREFLLKELRLIKNMTKYNNTATEINDFDTENMVKIPVNRDNEPVREFKVYKILRRLEI